MMTSPWIIMIAIFVEIAAGVRNEENIAPCAKVHVSSSIVPLGSPVNATCVIRDDCPTYLGQTVHIEWRLNHETVSTNILSDQSSREFTVVIPSFNHTMAALTCLTDNQIVGGVIIRAGYPPEIPQNLSCQANLTKPIFLMCSWDPGKRKTHLFTNYFLHTATSKSNFTYKAPAGVHIYTIPRSELTLFSEMIIRVRAENELGVAVSAPLTLEPVSSAKFEPPDIERIEVEPNKHGCLRLHWKLSKHDWVITNKLSLEVSLKTVDNSHWKVNSITFTKVRTARPLLLCSLLHGAQYWAQIRVRYKDSPWSEWSTSRFGVTPESAPTGYLDSWADVSWYRKSSQLNISLFWKPSNRFRANSQKVSYTVSRSHNGQLKKLCSTSGKYCTFQLFSRVKKIYLTAENGAGKSPPTVIRIDLPKGQTTLQNVSAVPHDNQSILVQWTSLLPKDLTGFVVTWRPILKEDLSYVQFEKVCKNQTSAVIAGDLEPYKPYRISVYPSLEHGIDLPLAVDTYLRQKAPSTVPEIKIKNTWMSSVELMWEKVPLEQQNGFIQQYRIFYKGDDGLLHVQSMDSETTKVLLKDLKPGSLFQAFMMVGTAGGSLNGSTINFKTESFGILNVVAMVSGFGIGLSLIIIVIFFSLSVKQKKIKRRLWPDVPDPANSSIKRWTSESTQFTHASSENEEPNQIYLSHLSFLDLTTNLSKEEDNLWLNSNEDTSDLGESICGSPFITEYTGSNSNSVPYATVIFSTPCNSQAPDEPHVYLRSESTQPLLEPEEPYSPQYYQNMSSVVTNEKDFFDACHEEPEEGPPIVWDDFPFLQALSMYDAEND